MSVTPSSAIVGVFREQTTAEQAMDAFYNAGFTHEQIRRSVPENSGGFFEDLKNLFTGSSNVAGDLTGMGLSDEEAQYYVQEQSNGNTILAVHAPGREQEAQTIMQQYGAYSAYARTNSSTQNTTSAASASDIQQDTTSTDTPVQPHTADTVTTQDTQQQPVEEQLSQDTQQSVNFVLVPNSDLAGQSSQTATERADSDPYHPQQSTPTYNTPFDTAQSTSSDTEPSTAQSATPDYSSTEQEDVQPVITTDSNTVETPDAVTTNNDTTYNQTSHEYSMDQQTQPSSIIQDTSMMHNSDQPTDTQEAQPLTTDTSPEQAVGDFHNVATEPLSTSTDHSVSSDTQSVQDTLSAADNTIAEPQTETTSESAPSTLTSQSGVSSENADELQQMQTQFTALQQQLQDVQAQLQAAKDQEAHLRTARERQQQVETLRQQMQALQAELAAAHAELQDTHARISQYQS